MEKLWPSLLSTAFIVGLTVFEYAKPVQCEGSTCSYQIQSAGTYTTDCVTDYRDTNNCQSFQNAHNKAAGQLESDCNCSYCGSGYEATHLSGVFDGWVAPGGNTLLMETGPTPSGSNYTTVYMTATCNCARNDPEEMSVGGPVRLDPLPMPTVAPPPTTADSPLSAIERRLQQYRLINARKKIKELQHPYPHIPGVEVYQTPDPKKKS